jgi:predicted ATPase with chaperone activity
MREPNQCIDPNTGNFDSTQFIGKRAYHYILTLARTIADLAGSEKIYSANLA